MIADLAKQSGKEEINSIVPEWISDYDKSKIEFDPTKGLPRLYRWGKEKENRSPSIPQKRARSATSTTPQTGSDMQIKSSETDALQNPPPFENIPLHFDPQLSTSMLVHSRELERLAAPQEQQHSPALSGVAPHFGASLLIKPMSGATSTLAGSNSEFIDGWDWTETKIDDFFPPL